MAQLQGKEKSAYVQNMFDRIAPRYNLLNRLISLGQDQRWRRFVVEKAQIPVNGDVLDLATGTGDVAFEILKRHPSANVVGGDFAIEMMFVGQKNKLGDHVTWVGADALNLPFAENTFDAVTSGYLMRNIPDLERGISEQLRVLKPGGRIVILDTAPPPHNILRPFILIHLKYVIPLLGRLISGKDSADAYQYLPESTQSFKTPEDLAMILEKSGVEGVQFKKFMFGTMAVHWGIKPH
jgi:demethylmenaquinone methyltransferase/2-methoxy-6-polyprenyl-1,4-benzoquinol methylase